MQILFLICPSPPTTHTHRAHLFRKDIGEKGGDKGAPPSRRQPWAFRSLPTTPELPALGEPLCAPLPHPPPPAAPIQGRAEQQETSVEKRTRKCYISCILSLCSESLALSQRPWLYGIAATTRDKLGDK